MTDNPFRPTRFEFDQSPLLWRSPQAVEIEGSEKNVYVKGSRGSGKTSLLRAINWQERVENPSLNANISEALWPCIGVYLRLPEHMSLSLHKVAWDKISDTASAPELEADYFSLFMEALALDGILEAAIGLRARRVSHYDVREEAKLLEEVLVEAPNLQNFELVKNLTGLARLQSIFKQLHRTMTAAATRGFIADVLKKLPTGRPGAILNSVASRLIKIMNLPSSGGAQNFKICVDDCETLRPHQRKALNTMVRSSRAPVLWVISFVSAQYETSSTFLYDQSLSGDDKSVFDFNDIKQSQFTDFCREVVRLRLKYSALNGQILHSGFSLAVDSKDPLHFLIGDLKANELFAIASSGRRNANLVKIKNSAKKLRDAALKSKHPRLVKFLNLDDQNDEANSDIISSKVDLMSTSLPYWQAYVLENHYGHTDFTNFIAENHNNLREFEQPLRRKQAAALLSMFKAIKFQQPFYASKFAIISMSDRCIRDFLELMAEIYDQAQQPKNRNLIKSSTDHQEPVVRYAAQARATYVSGKRKWVSIAQDRALGHDKDVAVEVAHLVHGLATLTSLLHLDPDGTKALSAPERGIFVLDVQTPVSGMEQDAQTVRDFLAKVVNRATMDGFLKEPVEDISKPERVTISGKAIKRKFQVHRRFSSYFQFSYRGSYSEVLLDPRDVSLLILNRKEIDPDDWAKQVYHSIAAETKASIVHPRLNFND